MIPTLTRLESAGSWDKRKFILKSLVEKSSSFSVENKALLTEISLAAQRDMKVVFNSTLAALLQGSKLGLDDWIFALEQFNTGRHILWRNMKKGLVILVQAVILAIASVIGGIIG